MGSSVTLKQYIGGVRQYQGMLLWVPLSLSNSTWEGLDRIRVCYCEGLDNIRVCYCGFLCHSQTIHGRG